MVLQSDSVCRCQKEGAMPSSTERVELVREKRDELKARIAEVGDSRPGSLVERYRRVIPAGAVTKTREQIAEYRRLRALVRELVETSEQLCDAKLEAGEAASDEAAKRGASRKLSRRRSRPKSRRS